MLGGINLDRFLHIIINQQSKNSDEAFKKLVIELPKHTNKYEFYITENIIQLERVIKDIKTTIAPDDLVVTVGGDGSLNQTVTFMEKYDLNNHLGYIPSGSGNDFARSHHIPTTPKKAIDHLFQVTKAKDVTIIHAVQGEQEHFAVNSLGIGIDGLVNHIIHKDIRKKSAGSRPYIFNLLNSFSKQQKFSVTLKVDDEVHRFDQAIIALVVNNPYFGGGINIIPHADGKDDTLEVFVGNDVTMRNLLKILFKLLINKSHLSHPKLYNFSGKKIALYTEAEEYAQKDGEIFKQQGFAYIFTTKKRTFWI